MRSQRVKNRDRKLAALRDEYLADIPTSITLADAWKVAGHYVATAERREIIRRDLDGDVVYDKARRVMLSVMARRVSS